MRNYGLYLKDIINAISSIEKFIQGMTFQDFEKDDKTTSAVIRKFEIIGEAAKHIPTDLQKKYSNIHWKEMAGMRDVLIHAYFGVDYKLIWTTIKKRLPQAKKDIMKIHLDNDV